MTALNEKDEKTDLPDQLASLLVKVENEVLLLPNVTVAEIVNLGRVEKIENKPDWYLGNINWRELDLPLISFEGMRSEGSSTLKGFSRVIILNGIIGNKTLPFYGMVSKGIPRLSRVSPGEIDQEEKTNEPTDFMKLSLNGEDVVIPNLENIEQTLIEAL